MSLPAKIRTCPRCGDRFNATAGHLVCTDCRITRDPKRARLGDSLTRREMQILRLLWLGFSNKAIAADLFLTVGTVKEYLCSMFRKMGVQSRSEILARRIQEFEKAAEQSHMRRIA